MLAQQDQGFPHGNDVVRAICLCQEWVEVDGLSPSLMFILSCKRLSKGRLHSACSGKSLTQVKSPQKSRNQMKGVGEVP